MSIEEQIKVMTAYKEGEKIEWKYNNEVDGWREVQDPAWNWRDLDYRVKPEIRPYTVEELLVAIREHGPMIKSEEFYYAVTSIVCNESVEVLLDNGIYAIEDLTSLVWQDGAPCGVVTKATLNILVKEK